MRHFLMPAFPGHRAPLVWNCTMNADEIRSIFLNFMAERGHAIIPRAPLIPRDDPTTLFTGSGMQPLTALPARRAASGRDQTGGQPNLFAGTGHRGRRRQPAHDLLRDARQLEPGRLLQGRTAAPVLDIHHRAGRAGSEPDLRLLLHRRPGERNPQGHRGGRHLDRFVHRGRRVG